MLVLSKTRRASYRSCFRGAGRFAHMAIGATCDVRVFCSIRRAIVDRRGNHALRYGYGTMPMQFTS
ncbi:hypothetical protein DF153_02880 [Burkholderia cenocepacia]|nr:hypothetical protein DF152_07410 [Burkholderia cenocepacia]RQU28072.1 hypothetical protein DF153_02880 [Burkholderia cenocepacia]